jgi:ParB family chromosome partitioning protein
MADKPKGKWAESASGYRPGSAPARGRPTRPWHVDAPSDEASAPAASPEVPLAWARTLPVRSLEPDPEQPRRTFDDAPLEELAASVREHGVLQPLIVRRNPDGDGGFVVVAGERRLRAARLAGLSDVPCMVLAGDSLRDARLAQLAENLQREDLAPMEEALAVVRLAELEALNQDELARRLGKSPAYISRIFAVSRIPSDEYTDLSASKPTMSVLYEYAQLRADDVVRARALALIRDGGTVRDLEALRGRRPGRSAKPAGARRGRPTSSAAPIEALRRASRALAKLDRRRVGAADLRAILAEQLELARWASAAVAGDAPLSAAVAALESALTRASAERPSTPEGTAGRAGRKGRSTRPR